MSQSNYPPNSYLAALLPLYPFYLVASWINSTGLWGTEEGYWFIAVLTMLCFECIKIADDWLERRKERAPYNDPDRCFKLLVAAVARAVLLVYLAIVVFKARSGYMAWLNPSVGLSPHQPLRGTWVLFVPWSLAGVLLFSSLYGLAMGLKYARSPRDPGQILSALIKLAGAAAVLWFWGLFFPLDWSAWNFFLLWVAVRVILIQVTKLLVVLRGEGRAARARVEDSIREDRIPWITEEQRVSGRRW